SGSQSVDGHWGTQTEGATEFWQANHGLKQDGCVGRQTLRTARTAELRMVEGGPISPPVCCPSQDYEYRGAFGTVPQQIAHIIEGGAGEFSVYTVKYGGAEFEVP